MPEADLKRLNDAIEQRFVEREDCDGGEVLPLVDAWHLTSADGTLGMLSENNGIICSHRMGLYDNGDGAYFAKTQQSAKHQVSSSI